MNRRILPFLATCYLFAYLDRINIGFAKLQMQNDLALSDAAYGLGAGIFFFGYMLFEVPSNLLLVKIGARRTLSRILILWGIVSASMLFVTDVWTFYALRFLLGVFEAGFAPGMIYYLTQWYPGERMARAMAVVLGAAPLGGVIGAGIHLDHGPLCRRGRPGGLAVDVPGRGHPLHPARHRGLRLPGRQAGRRALADRCAESRHRRRYRARRPGAGFVLRQGAHRAEAVRAGRGLLLPDLRRVRGRLLAAFDPQICRPLGPVSDRPLLGHTEPRDDRGHVRAGPAFDRRRERHLHSAITAVLGAGLLAWAAYATSFPAALISITLASAAIFASYSVFWAIPQQHLKGTAAAGGIALINSIGLFGGFFSPTLIGWTKEATGSLQAGLLVMAALLVLGAVLLATQRTQQPPAR